MSAPPRETLVRAREAGVTAFVVVGTDARTCAEVTALAASHDDVWATVGLHPHDAVDGVDTVVPFLDSPRVVAVGECGLDYHYDHSPRDVQRSVFAAQVDLAHRHDRAVRGRE
jgi:TatD DNase family protein